jgi:hypothetical protein
MPGPFGEAPVAKSLLDFQRVLSPTAGVRVSPLCLGAMNFGDAWTELMGKCDKKTTFEILDYFYEQGGNFIDTYVLCIPLSPKHLPIACFVRNMPLVGCNMLTLFPVQTTTKTKNPKSGSANGWRPARIATPLSSLQSSPPLSQRQTHGREWLPIMLETAQSRFASRSRRV